MIYESQSRNERNNKIINSIMSGHAPVLLLCPVNPSYLDFLPDLFNNYRTVYTYNASWESQTDFVLCLAQKVLPEQDFEIARSFCRCGIRDCKRIVLKKVFSVISKLPNDCLLFVCGLDDLTPAFDLSLLDYFMENGPDNLKIVFCSKKILHLSYRSGNNILPRIIICDRPGEELPFKEELLEDGYLTAQQKEVLSRLSFYRFVEKDFAEELYPGICDLLNAVFRNFRFVLSKLGDCYCFSPDFYKKDQKLFQDKTLHSELYKSYLEYFLRKKDYVSVLEKSILFGESSYIDQAVVGLIEQGKEDYLYSYAVACQAENVNAPFFNVISLFVKGHKDLALEELKKIPDCEMKKYIYFFISFSMTENRKDVFSSFCTEMSDFSPEKIFYCRIITMLTYSEEKILGADEKFFENTKKIFESGSKDIAFLHYLSKIHAATGNYDIAKEYLTRISEICEYYTYSYVQSWSFFFNMSIDTVGTFARENDNALLGCCDCLYRGDRVQAINYLRSIGADEQYSTDGMLSLALQSILYAEAGNPEFGKSLASLYAVSAERDSRAEASFFYIAIAYCEFLLRNHQRAISILNNCKKGQFDSFFSFLEKALEINCALDTERISVLDSQIKRLFSIAKEKCYDNAIIVLRSCFLPLLSYAEKRDIQTKYVSDIYMDLLNKKESLGTSRGLLVKYFGNSAVYVDKREIVWKTKKCKELFLLYYLHPEGLERNRIIEEIWSDYVYASAVNNLKTTNNLVRHTLKEYGIPFRFTYSNGKYCLTIEGSECDYISYIGMSEEYLLLTDIRAKVNLLGRMLAYSEEGFAVDCDLKEFQQIVQKIKEDISLYLSDAIKELIQEKDYLNAKRFLLKLEKIGLFDCSLLKTEIDKMVYKK